jgi:CHAD domain-containing protein
MRNRPLLMTDVVRPVEAVELTGDLAVGDGLQEMLARALAVLARRSSGAQRPGADAVHRFRVGVRRLRSILAAFSLALPERERRALGDRLRAVAQRYGRVREWDVFLGQCVDPLCQAMPQEEAMAALERQARRARRLALPPGDTLKSNLLEIKAAIEEAAWLRRPGPDQAPVWDMPLGDYAASLLAKRHRRLRKQVKSVDIADPAAFHQLRIRVKKLRYPVELMKSLFDEKRAKDYLERLVELQDLMGRMNDARVAQNLLHDLKPPATATAVLAGWLAREIASGRERFPASARAFRRADPFWEK